jgi:hypothetical protein
MSAPEIDLKVFFDKLSQTSEALHHQSRYGHFDSGSKVAMAAAHYVLSAIVEAGRAALQRAHS